MSKLHRIYDDHAYDPDVPVGSYWESTVPPSPPCPALDGDRQTGVLIVGAGYTGLSAALHLARDFGETPTVIDAAQPGWGASGRNAGFCGFGGSKLEDAAIIRRFGESALYAFYDAQKQAIELVRALTDRHGIEADIQEEGEYCLAHSASAALALPKMAAYHKDYAGLECPVLSEADLRAEGCRGRGLFGGLLIPRGFGLNPRKYVNGLTRAAQQSGAEILAGTPALSIREEPGGSYLVETPQGQIRTDRLIVANNGYGSENVPDWLGGRYLPVVSHVLVTRPLSEPEKQSQGWTTRRISYDTRNLLHYFRLLPDDRMLFGMRGTNNLTANAMNSMRARIRRNFESMFPDLAAAETEFHWSGLICLTRTLVPYAGPIGDWSRAWTGMAYHGTGVAMATYTGRLLAGLAAGQAHASPLPRLMREVPPVFPMPGLRRRYLPAAYALYGLLDRF